MNWVVDIYSVATASVDNAQGYEDRCLCSEFPFRAQTGGHLLLEEACVNFAGEPMRQIARVVFACNALVEVVVVFVTALGEAGHNKPAHAGLGVLPDTATPLRLSDFQ